MEKSGSEISAGSPVKIIHTGYLLRRIILILQYLLAVTVFTIGILIWNGSMDFKYFAHFLGLLSLLTGAVIYTSCSHPKLLAMRKFFSALGLGGLLSGIGSSLVFWQVFPIESWYYFNLLLVIGICASLFAETEKGKTVRSVVHVVASIIIIITFLFLILHITGMVDLRLPLLILTGALTVLIGIVIYRNRKVQGL